MFATLFDDGAFFSNHWNIVICAGAAFLLIQLLCSARFYRRVRRQERTLASLYNKVEQGGDGREGIDAVAKRFAWLKWVNAIFPAHAETPPGNYTRDDVLKELDTRLASDADYLLLQRLGVMAPLLGVVLTVLGFFFLEVPDAGEQSLESIIHAVMPLVVGVGTGAVLAMINQFPLLYLASGRAESLRMVARTWFDAAIWSGVGLDTQAATVKAISAIERMATSVAKSAEEHQQSSTRIGASTAAIESASSRFREIVSLFGDEIKDMPAALVELRDATVASSNALEELIPVGTRAVSNLDVSVAAFRTTIDREFNAAAKTHEKTISNLSTAAASVNETTEALKSGAEHFKQTVDATASSLETLNQSLADGAVTSESVVKEYARLVDQLGPTQKALAAAVEQLAGAARSLTDLVADDVAPSRQSFSEAASALADAGTQLTMFVEQLGPAAEQLNSLQAKLDATAPAGDVRAMRGDINRLTETISQMSGVSDAISELPERLHQAMTRPADQKLPQDARGGGLVGWLRGEPAPAAGK